MSDQAKWTEVDKYFNDALLNAEPALDASLRVAADAGLPAIAVAPNQGKLLRMLATMIGAKSILEVGTLGGYSTIWLAGALPAGGRLLTLELDPKHAAVASESLTRAGFAPGPDRTVEIRVGPALESLAALNPPTTFDLVFIDADKAGTPTYLTHALRLSHPGTIIVIDNAVRRGEVINHAGDESVQGMRRAVEALSCDRRVDAVALQTVGDKGYDGFILIRVT